MPNNGKTIFQNLSSIMGISKPDAVGNNQFLSNSLPGNEILFATNDKAEYERDYSGRRDRQQVVSDDKISFQAADSGL